MATLKEMETIALHETPGMLLPLLDLPYMKRHSKLKIKNLRTSVCPAFLMLFFPA